MTQIRQGDSPTQLVLSIEQSTVILPKGDLLFRSLDGAFADQLNQAEISFIEAVADCFNGFDDAACTSLRLRVLIGEIEKFRLNYAHRKR